MYVVLGALVGGAVFMRLGTWLQHVDLRENASLAEQWLYGNRSILGGLVGAWLGVHVAKRLVGYRARTGDLFAPAVALGMAVGRVGCLLTELPGTPTGTSYGIRLDADAAAAARRTRRRTAAPVVRLRDRLPRGRVLRAVVLAAAPGRRAPGETLTFYLAAYGIFRFLVEFVRGNEVAWQGLTRPQLFLLVTVPLLLARIAWQARRGVYRRPPATRPLADEGAGMSQPARRPPPPGYGPPPAARPLPAARCPLVVGALLGGVDCRGHHAARPRCRRQRRHPGSLSFVGPVVGLAIPVVLLFSPATRWWGVGMLIGYFLTLIVLGGACVALIASFSG